MSKYILFDTETTGTQDEDKIIQIAAIIIDENKSLDFFNQLCFSDQQIKIELWRFIT